MQPGDEVVIVYKGEDALGIVERCDPELDSVLVSLTLSSGARIQTVRRLADCLPRAVAEAAAAAEAAENSQADDADEDEFEIDIEASQQHPQHQSRAVGFSTPIGANQALDPPRLRPQQQQQALHMYSCSAPPSAPPPVCCASLALPLSVNVGAGSGAFFGGFAVSPFRLSASSSFSFPPPAVSTGGGGRGGGAGGGPEDPQQLLAVTPPSSLSSSFSGGDASSASLTPLSPRGKCRRIYGVDNRRMWCTQCRWKKACTRFKPAQTMLPAQSSTGMQ
ncbi:hypothetical protein BOX15_Mlig021442g2 [Macrostomum lignano]|uniref:DUF4772 domain-containing protein n=1 Tax=Macrostomum lignano TaxID=282301 RepID=A0A267DAC1_9PLAT|nr:hypothetical protein BOX15_Mlig021442g2 [Macrostomum lignano]